MRVLVTNIFAVQSLPRASAIGGGLLWPFVAARLVGNGLGGVIASELLLGVLVIVPLAMMLIATPKRDGFHCLPYRVACRMQPPSAALAAISFLLPVGLMAGFVASFWLMTTLALACFGIWRLLPSGFRCPEEVCIDAGLIYLPVGAAWLMVSRFGLHPFGFVEPIVLLTAVHFHYAGFLALVLAGMTGRKLGEIDRPRALRLFRATGWGMIVGLPLVAIGITLSPLTELIGVSVLVASVVLLAGLVLYVVTPATQDRAAQALLIASAASAIAAIVLAGYYGFGEFTETFTVSVPRMAWTHGLLNVLGFATAGTLAWVRVKPRSLSPEPGIPFSRFFSRGKVGPDFFRRIGAIPTTESAPTGLVDSLDDYQRPDFKTGNVHPAIRAFYEQTARHELIVRAHWRRGFRLGARLWTRFSSRMEQMNLPSSADVVGNRIDSFILPLTDSMDGRAKVRAWVRTYRDTGRAVYVAAYATHAAVGQTYMNIAFPMPGGNITSILRSEPMPLGGAVTGIVLTTWPRHRVAGDEGVYFANRILPLRLPLNETIRVWPADYSPKPFEPHNVFPLPITILARHEVWLLGVKFLSLEYAISDKTADDHPRMP